MKWGVHLDQCSGEDIILHSHPGKGIYVRREERNHECLRECGLWACHFHSLSDIQFVTVYGTRCACATYTCRTTNCLIYPTYLSLSWNLWEDSEVGWDAVGTPLEHFDEVCVSVHLLPIHLQDNVPLPQLCTPRMVQDLFDHRTQGGFTCTGVSRSLQSMYK